MLAFHKSLRDF
jgi:deoxycytidylate deaminase